MPRRRRGHIWTYKCCALSNTLRHFTFYIIPCPACEGTIYGRTIVAHFPTPEVTLQGFVSNSLCTCISVKSCKVLRIYTDIVLFTVSDILALKFTNSDNVRLQMGVGRNLFQHVSGRGLALFTHAPITEFVYLISGPGAGLSIFFCAGRASADHEGSGGHWRCVQRRLGRDYEEEDVETGKKRRPKPPRGAAKRESGSTGTSKTAEEDQSAATAARKATVKRLRNAGKGEGGHEAKK
ncbi:hypothetical protein GGX14DRAFT_390966 [Mycena pura]|uniref:Uncharacterized protein n=1 Tax=Mycena pura TaxID=153505 RepID=A0AAD6VR47_9AGAR|nr:hypothetical protein GGX14DRAFT_390966 [Mycena pura]